MTTIGLLGATGYTGKLVATELVRRNLPCRLAGRDRARLAALPVPVEVPRVVVDVAEPGAVDEFLEGVDALISCVGPFAALGMPVVEAAARAGAVYVDSTGEPAFMEQVYRRFGGTDDGAVSTPLVPACGFDFVPGDLAAAVAVADLAPDKVGQVLVAYELSAMAPSRGTARTALAAIGDLSLAPRIRQVPFPDGERTAVDLPWGESVTVPRWAPGADVVTCLALGGAANRLGAMGAELGRAVRESPLGAGLGRAVRGSPLGAGLERMLRGGVAGGGPGPAPDASPVESAGRRAVEAALRPALGAVAAATRSVGPGVDRLLDRLPEGPSELRRSRASFTIVAVATGAGGGRAGVVCQGSDVYGLTARLLVEAALRSGGAGALTPAQALDPVPFLTAVADGGAAAGGPGSLTWRRFQPRS